MTVSTVNPCVNLEALKSDVRAALINQKAFACPIAMRVAWHAAGTFDKSDGSGGSHGATMRFEPEISDPANEGLHIVRDMLHEVKKKYPAVSMADLWAFAGCVAIEFMGGPMPPFRFGRKDDPDGKRCPLPGRLPDASQGPEHLREVFYRMGFNDQEIVALSGGHTVGRCHAVRSGFDGAWTAHPLRFDNEYFRNLLDIDWQPKKWDGPFQYTDPTDTFVMLPTDVALIQDPVFRVHVERYAADQDQFFHDFAAAYGKLMALGCPDECDPGHLTSECTPQDHASAEFREAAMHGSLGIMKRLANRANVHEVEASSGRSALHKAAFWGHLEAVRYLANDLRLDLHARDWMGDTPLHDAARFGHREVARLLISAGADPSVKNNAGQDPLALATEYGKNELAELMRKERGPLK
ncbi:MAG TPA: peroxidase family protein [Pirellulaceae bacterium]